MRQQRLRKLAEVDSWADDAPTPEKAQAVWFRWNGRQIFDRTIAWTGKHICWWDDVLEREEQTLKLKWWFLDFFLSKCRPQAQATDQKDALSNPSGACEGGREGVHNFEAHKLNLIERSCNDMCTGWAKRRNCGWPLPPTFGWSSSL